MFSKAIFYIGVKTFDCVVIGLSILLKHNFWLTQFESYGRQWNEQKNGDRI